MPVTNYITANGMLVGEMTGGVMTAYGPDALGSVVATYSGSSLQNTYQYKPYGSTLAKTGSATDPSFLWNGASGYRATGVAQASHYVRRRTFSAISGFWTTEDPFWSGTNCFVYCNSNPISMIDPSGLLATTPPIWKGWWEAYARTHSVNQYFGVRGTVMLPLFCDTCDDSNTSFLTFYLSFTSGSGTAVDCGLSLTCPRGWKKAMNPGPGRARRIAHAGCPECGPGSLIQIELKYVGVDWNCIVNGTSLGFVTAEDNNLMPLPGPLPVQMAIGAGWNLGDQEPQHTSSIWSGLQVLDATDNWSPWNASVWTSPTTLSATYYQNPTTDVVGGYSINSAFPLNAQLINSFYPNQPCGCPSPSTSGNQNPSS